jgi:hypothetical protein
MEAFNETLIFMFEKTNIPVCRLRYTFDNEDKIFGNKSQNKHFFDKIDSTFIAEKGEDALEKLSFCLQHTFYKNSKDFEENRIGYQKVPDWDYSIDYIQNIPTNRLQVQDEYLINPKNTENMKKILNLTNFIININYGFKQNSQKGTFAPVQIFTLISSNIYYFLDNGLAFNQWIAISNYIINLLTKRQKFEHFNLQNKTNSNEEIKMYEIDIDHTFQLKNDFKKAFQLNI